MGDGTDQRTDAQHFRVDQRTDAQHFRVDQRTDAQHFRVDCLLAEIEEASCEPKTTTFFRQFMIDQQAGAKMVSTSFFSLL